MTLNEFQERAMSTAVYPRDVAVTYPILGVNAEAGELANALHKALRLGHSADALPTYVREKLIDEAGDVLWNLAALAHDLSTSLENIAQHNQEKLAARVRNGQLTQR